MVYVYINSRSTMTSRFELIAEMVTLVVAVAAVVIYQCVWFMLVIFVFIFGSYKRIVQSKKLIKIFWK